jgi:hypothetical protein
MLRRSQAAGWTGFGISAIVSGGLGIEVAAGALREENMGQEEISLDSLGLSFGTDKSSWGHDYLRFYEDHFFAFRSKNIKLLEIGLAGGASLKVWENYFSNARIIGADINPDVKKYASQRVTIEIIDQSDISDLIHIGVKHGPFDIIIDDGSHMWDHQITTLKTLFPFLAMGGIYIVEDLQTSFGNMQQDFRGVSNISCVEFLKKLTDLKVAHKQIDISKEEDAFLRSYGRKIRSITFYRESCLIQNGYVETADKPLVEIPPDKHDGFSILAHLGCYGDRKVQSSVICGRGTAQNIQGFAIYHDGIASDELCYRARLKNGTWTDWGQCGEFVGTRGTGEDLTGVSVRLAGRSQQAYSVKLVGAFRGETDNVIVGNGEECMSKSGNGQLWGMQIIMTER